MPRDGAITFADLIGRMDVVYVHCGKCGRAGRYHLQQLIDERGRDARVIDWLDEMSDAAPKYSFAAKVYDVVASEIV